MAFYPSHPTTFAPAYAPQGLAPQPYQAPPIPPCSICAYGSTTPPTVRAALRIQDYNAGLNGLIAYLPPKDCVPDHSIAHQQPLVLGDGAFKHPCVILGTSPCGHMVQCLPATSWGGQSLEQKWRNIRNPQMMAEKRFLWSALKRRDTVPHNDLGSLDHSGPEMPSQTYIHKDHAYWIEWSFLDHFKHADGKRQLTAESFQRLVQQYQAAVDHIRIYGRCSSPSSSPRCSPRTPPTPPHYYQGPANGYFTPCLGSHASMPMQQLPSPPPSPPALFQLQARANKAIAIVRPTSPSEQHAASTPGETTVAQPNSAEPKTTTAGLL